MRIDVHVVTRRSQRHAVNEDRAVVGSTVLDTSKGVEHHQVHPPAVLAVLDGLGGHPAGDVASELAAQVLAQSDIPRDEGSAGSLLRSADQALHDDMRDAPERFAMGTTAVVVALTGEDGLAVTANVGDSPAWQFSGGSLVLLSVSDRGYFGGIEQCLGAHEQGVQPHVGRTKLDPGDLLLLASDGLSDVVPTPTIEQVLREGPSRAIEHLHGLVEQAGYPDDLTIVLAETRSD